MKNTGWFTGIDVYSMPFFRAIGDEGAIVSPVRCKWEPAK